jgi:hypothetical protein
VSECLSFNTQRSGEKRKFPDCPVDDKILGEHGALTMVGRWPVPLSRPEKAIKVIDIVEERRAKLLAGGPSHFLGPKRQ